MKKMFTYLVFLNICLFTTTVKAADIIAAGSANIRTHGMSPLLAISHNSGSSWNYKNDLVEGKNVNGVGCVGKFCAIAGDFVAVTEDGGFNWLKVSIADLPKPYLQGLLNAISCRGDMCVAGGIFRYDYEHYDEPQPIVAVTQDSGATWFYPQSIYNKTVLPKNFKSGYFTSVSCSEKICVAIGPGETLLLAMTTDKGSTWEYPAAVHSTALPANFLKGSFYQTSCNDKTCIAVGGYDLKTNPEHEKPLLALTQDAGNNWNYSATITSGLPANFLSGRLTSAYCNENVCITTGFYKYEEGTMKHGRPLLAVSRDHGLSWVYPKEIYTTALPKLFLEGAYLGNGISCSNKLCVASGFLRSSFGETRPLLAVSKDSGKSWSYPASIYLTALPHNFVSGEFDGGAVCEGNHCSVTGHFYDGHQDYPLIAVTNDGGNTWTYPQSVYASANLPKQYDGAANFGGIAGNE